MNTNLLLESEVAKMLCKGRAALAEQVLQLAWYRLYAAANPKSYQVRLLYLNLVVLEGWRSDDTETNYITEQELQIILSNIEELAQCLCAA